MFNLILQFMACVYTACIYIVTSIATVITPNVLCHLPYKTVLLMGEIVMELTLSYIAILPLSMVSSSTANTGAVHHYFDPHQSSHPSIFCPIKKLHM